MDSYLEVALIECLDALEQGQPIDQVLARYPELAAELPLPSGEDRTRIGIDKQFRNVSFSEPMRVILHNVMHIPRFAVERNFSWPR